MGKNLDQNEIKMLQNIFETSGAIDFGKSIIKKYVDKAQYIVNQIPFENKSVRVAFDYLIEKISNLSV